MQMNDFLTLAATLEETAATLKELAKVPTVETPPKGEFLTVRQTADYLGVKVCTVYGLIRKKVLPVYKPGGQKSAVYFKIEDINAWIEGHRIKSQTEEDTAAVELLEHRPKRGRRLKAMMKEGGNA